MPFSRGPDDLKDLPALFRPHGQAGSISRAMTCGYSPRSSTRRRWMFRRILARAAAYRAAGADVIDLGCLPDTPFPHLEDSVVALRDAGYKVSVDSADSEELRRGGKAGADFLLSLSEDTLDVLDSVAATPVLIPAQHGDLDSLLRAMEPARRQRPRLSRRSDPRSHPFRLCRLRCCAMSSSGAAGPMRRFSWGPAI